MIPLADQDDQGIGPVVLPGVSSVARHEAAVFAPGLLTLRHRPDFLRCATGRKQGTAGFLLQARARDQSDEADLPRVGFTATKKIGNAVARNRAKRRLRALAREVLNGAARPGWDYVLVARPGATTTRDFASLWADLAAAIAAVHGGRP